MARLDGNVVVQNDMMILTCDHMLVFFDSKKDETAKGKASGQKEEGMAPVRSVEADGNVRLVAKEKRQTVTGDHAVYDKASGTVTLDGNCMILGDGGQVMRSNRVVFNESTGTLTAARVSLTVPVRTKGEGSGVSGLFGGLPDDRKKEEPKPEPAEK